MQGVRILKISLLAIAVAGVALGVASLVYAQAGPRPGQRPPMPLPELAVGGQIGVSIHDVQAEDVKRLKLSGEAGAIIDDVRPRSPASAAGLRENDVIVEYDGERVRSTRQLTRLVLETPPGRRVKVVVLRDSRRSDVEVTPAAAGPGFPFEGQDFAWTLEGLGRFGRDMAQNFRVGPGAPEMRMRSGRLGAAVMELSPDLASYFGVKDGVLVSSVAENSAAAKAGLKAGDVITAFEDRAIGSSSELLRALDDKDGDVTVTVVRDKKELKLKARLEGPRTTRRRMFRRVAA